MADYIDREALVERLTRNLNACNPGTFSERCYQDAINTVNFFPAVDVAPVVRCKDCKLEGTEKCPMVHRDLLFGNLYAETKPDAFCSYGERRTDERKTD